jgi:type VI secretion system secreted protein Hcp
MRGCRHIAGAALIAAGTAGVRADEAFLRIEAVTIAASDRNYDSWINLLAFGDGSVRGPLAPLSRGGSAATPPTFNDIAVHKRVDSNSPKLMQYCASGKSLPAVQIDFVRGPDDTGPYAQIKLERVKVTSYSFSGSAWTGPGDEGPEESITFVFGKLNYWVEDREKTGVWQTTYDISKNSATSSASKAGNNPPVISGVSTQVLTAGRQHKFEVTVGDPDSSLESLTLTGLSDNPALLPAASFEFAGTGGVREVRLTPLPGATGIAHASLTVSDGSGTTTTFFMVAVGPPPESNVILEPAAVAEHSPAGKAVGLLVAVPPSPLGPPQWELLDSAGGRFRLEGDMIVVNDPFLLDFESSPRPVIVVRLIEQGILRGIQALTVEVQDVPEGAFDDWRRAQFSDTELLDPNVAGPYANPDGDEFNNLLEYSQGFPPKDGSNAPLPHLGEIEIGGMRYLTLTYRQRPPAFDPDLSVMPEISRELSTWECGPAHFIHVSTLPLPGGLEEVTVRSARPVSDVLRELVRLRVLR